MKGPLTMLLSLLPLLAAAAMPAHAASHTTARSAPHLPVVVPFTIVGDHIVVDALVNGRPGRFILDTGSGATSVAPGFAEGVDLQVHGGPMQAAGAGQGATEIRMGTARFVRIGPMAFDGMPVLVLSNDPFKPLGQAMSGAFGYDVFAKWTVGIDFDARTLTFIAPGSYTPPANGIVLPVDLSLRVPIVKVTMRATADSGPLPAKLVLDTGTSNFAVLFSKDFAARAHLGMITPRRTLALGSGSGGLSIGTVMRVAIVNVGGLKLRAPVIGVPGDKAGFFASGVADGTIGQGLFRRGRLTVDYPHNRVVFEPGPGIDAAWEYADRCGWTLGKDADGDWAVAYLGADAPAADAGVQKGDKLVEIDGKPAAGLDREALRAACTGPGELPLTLRRGSVTVSPTLHKRKLI